MMDFYAELKNLFGHGNVNVRVFNRGRSFEIRLSTYPEFFILTDPMRNRSLGK